MARSDYGPEVKSAMKEPPRKGAPGKRPPPPKEKETPGDIAMDKQRGIAQGSPQDQAMDARLGPTGAVAPQPPHPPAPGGANPAHAMMAASIAHAILGGSKGGGY